MTLGRIRVLLIDDDEDDFANIRGILEEIERSQYSLTWKASYDSGLEALKKSQFDICLLDFRLGAKTGLDMLKEAKDLGLSTPMILLTGYGDFEIDIKAMQSGAADYLVKAHITSPLLERAIRYSVKHAWDMRDLAEQRENFKVLFNSTREGIVVHREGHIVDANAAMDRIFGSQPGQLIHRKVEDLIRSDFHQKIKPLLVPGEDQRVEAVGLKFDGSEVALDLASQTILLKGQSVSLMAVRDITQRKQMETQILQQDRLASLGLLASSLAHEIGTPLGVIRGRAELIAKSGDEKTKSNMDIITKQIDRVSKLVNSLLHIARGGKADFVANVQVRAVIEDVANLMSHELRRKDIAFNFDVAKDAIVRGESGPLGQVILNLMVNSVHAIEDVQKSNTVRAHAITIAVQEDADLVEIKVSDTGTGISHANLKNLFKPFFTTKDVGLGTGLGLATSYKLIQSWGGTITVDSREREGTAFTIRLPAGRN